MCWHCKGTNRCSCLFCSGSCGFCEARKLQQEFQEVFMPDFEASHLKNFGRPFDPRDPQWWDLRDRHRVYLPFELFLVWRERRQGRVAA